MVANVVEFFAIQRLANVYGLLASLDVRPRVGCDESVEQSEMGNYGFTNQSMRSRRQDDPSPTLLLFP